MRVRLLGAALVVSAVLYVVSVVYELFFGTTVSFLVTLFVLPVILALVIGASAVAGVTGWWTFEAARDFFRDRRRIT